MRKHLTTVGRFWGYVSVFIALGVSLAGNVTAAYLHQDEVNPNVEPSWVDVGFAGLPPLAAFLVIELANHNPWKNTDWGPKVLNVLLVVIAPGSAIVSFIHLVTVVVHGRATDWTTPEGILTWVTAVLTALLIDGLMFGGTAALLLPEKRQEGLEAPQARPGGAVAGLAKGPATTALPKPAVSQGPPRPVLSRQPVLKATLAQQQEGPKKYRAHEHPLWDRWHADLLAGSPWSSETMVKEMKVATGRDLSRRAAAEQIRRWQKSSVS